MTDLLAKKCIPCSLGAEPLGEDQMKELHQALKEGWKILDSNRLEKAYMFKNFKEALEFTNQVGEIAEREGHHPDICLSWGKVVLTLFTHKINGLHENDFILAAKIDQLMSM